MEFFQKAPNRRTVHFHENLPKIHIYLHRSGPLLKNGLDRPKNRYGRYGLPSFYSIFIATVGADGARVCL